MTTVRLHHVSQRLGGRTVLADVSATFPEGRISLLLGPNGSGKTTLLRLCALLDAPSEGRVSLVGGAGGGSERRRVTMVFQRPVVFRRSVRENLAYPLRVRRAARAQRERRVAEALAVSGLEALAERPARRLSGGESQRLALARAFVLHPEVLLLDEPAANLDPESRERIDRMLRAMRERFGTTVVHTTHDLLHARQTGHVVYYLEAGRLSGPYEPAGFFGRPPTAGAARFLRGVLEPWPE